MANNNAVWFIDGKRQRAAIRVDGFQLRGVRNRMAMGLSDVKDVSTQRHQRAGFFHPLAQQPLLGQGLVIIETSRSHSDTPRSVGLLWTSDQLDAETST
jgi:hypothetical protein